MSLSRWKSLPSKLRLAVESRIGASVSSTVDTFGCAPYNYSGEVFTARGITHVVAVEHGNFLGLRALRREAFVSDFLSTLPPRYVWGFESLTWTVAGFEHVSGVRPDIRPGSPDLAVMVRVLTRLANVSGSYLRPGDEITFRRVAEFESLATRLAHESAWRTLVTSSPRVLDPWDRPRTKLFIDYELLLFDVLAGALCAAHTDISASSVLLTPSGPRLVGWHNVATAPKWVDPAVFAVHLVANGHSPEEADKLVSQVPAWQQASVDSLDAFAVSLLGRWVLADRSATLKNAARRYAAYRLARTE